jgi:ABC-type multidrug transport system ATPase subunit
MMTHMLTRIGIWKEGLGHYFTENKNSQPYLVMEFIDVIIYAGLLAAIERIRIWLSESGARRTFGDYGDFFRNEKAKHPVTQEAKDMEAEVATCHDYAVRVENCSRLFFNTAGDPIPAVNCVSLGVKQGSLFGFLGANGAGKTTLICMITSMLPISDGKIEIMGRDITQYNDPTLLSICPQFNTHLCQQLTPYEHFVIYSWLFQLDAEEAERETNRLIKVLELDEIKDKPIGELSSGDVRKLAIALSFLGPAKIILLDEPTASLDAVARHAVHQMILDFRGEKTFMLCTHLLSEAETLCDQISIMIKGCVYTVGSPGYLSGKFGTEYKVDVMLIDSTPEATHACDQFFSKNCRRQSYRSHGQRQGFITYPHRISDCHSSSKSWSRAMTEQVGSTTTLAPHPHSSACSWRSSECRKAMIPTFKTNESRINMMNSILNSISRESAGPQEKRLNRLRIKTINSHIK